MDWFLYDSDLRHEKVKHQNGNLVMNGKKKISAPILFLISKCENNKSNISENFQSIDTEVLTQKTFTCSMCKQ